MKRIYVTAIFCFMLAILPMKAQYFTLGPEVGYERANLQTSCDGLSTKSGNGFRIGAVAAYNFRNGLFLQSGLAYSHRDHTKIYNVSGLSQFPHVKDIEVRRMEFLTLPLTVGYELSLPKGWGIGVEAGGYVGVGLSDGSTLFRNDGQESSGGSLFEDSTWTFYNEATDNREPVTIKASDRIDAGVTMGGHIRFRQIRLRAYYQLGLNKTIYDIAMPRTFVLSLSYDFKL